MSEIEEHIGTAEEKLKAAKVLLTQGLYNDAISRGYYSMFHAAKAILLLKDINPKKHSGVISMFGLHFVNKGYIEEVHGKALTKGAEYRGSADYDITFRATEEMAESVIQDAERFLDRIKRALSEL
ncbi:MAG: HEPN domain-containing protein [Candidatus Hydrothermarchaeaceae archaeon]